MTNALRYSRAAQNSSTPKWRVIAKHIKGAVDAVHNRKIFLVSNSSAKKIPNMVIWLTGLSGAGKTTLAKALRDILKPGLPHTVLIDGDTVREAFAVGLGYSEPERREQIQRIQRLAKILADQDLIVIVAALYCHPDLLAWNREHLKGYFEVYLEASMGLLRQRDQKCLYSQAESGIMDCVVGIDIPWHAPQAPHYVIHSDEQVAAHMLAQRLIEACPTLE